MRISDWSSDVCSSDLPTDGQGVQRLVDRQHEPFCGSNNPIGSAPAASLPGGGRLRAASACSMICALVPLIVQARSAPCTCWPMPVACRYSSVRRAPYVQYTPVLNSTQETCVRAGHSVVPLRYTAPHIAWPILSKPTLPHHGPLSPKAGIVTRMISGLTACNSDQDKPIHSTFFWSKLAITISAVWTSILVISGSRSEVGL